VELARGFGLAHSAPAVSVPATTPPSIARMAVGRQGHSSIGPTPRHSALSDYGDQMGLEDEVH